MTADPSTPPAVDDILGLVTSLAEVELAYARELLWRLPSTTRFEDKIRCGLRVGAFGRRLAALLNSAGISGSSGRAPRPPSFLESAGSSDWKGSRVRLKSLYDRAIGVLKPHGLHVHPVPEVLRRSRAGLKKDEALHRSGRGEPAAILDSLTRSRVRRSPNARVRSRRGNPVKRYDPRWRLVGPGEPVPAMASLDTELGRRHKLHHTAFRETVAAEVAGLSLFEYDGMPWSFYIDMARQVEDEVRHASMARERLLAEGGRMGEFPLPHFGNHYHMFLEMSLFERLVAMNLDTEALGQTYLKEAVQRMDRLGHRPLGRLFRLLAYDEKRHARFGAKWLKYLFPETGERRRMVETARALVIVNLASQEAVLTSRRVGQVIDQWSAGLRPVRVEPSGEAETEREITLLSARRRSAKD